MAELRPATLRERVYARDGHRCVACPSTENLTLDHWIPRSRGGTHEDTNLQTMCKGCNVAKGGALPTTPQPEPAPGFQVSYKPGKRKSAVVRRVTLADLHPRVQRLLI